MRAKFVIKRLITIGVFATAVAGLVLFLLNSNHPILNRPLQALIEFQLDPVEVPVCDTCCYKYQNCVNSTHCNSTFIPLSDDELERRHCKRRLPQAIIFGTKKSGTSALRTFLSYHPDIAAAKQETNFFNRNSLYNSGPKLYTKMMPLSTKNQITLEKTPIYYAYYTSGIHYRVHKVLPNAKLIIILRDPVKRAISDYFMETRYLFESGKKLFKNKSVSYHGYELANTFEKSVLTEAGGKVDPLSKFVDLSIYVKALSQWLGVFTRSSILAIDGEAFTRDPLPALKDVERFLGVRSFFDEASFITEENRGFRCLAKPLRRCWKSANRKPHPPLEEDVTKKLRSFFKPYNKKLAQLLNQTFDW